MERREFLVQSAGAMAAVALFPSTLPAAPIRRGEPLPVGVIGVGRQGRLLIGELQKLDACKVVAICDNDATRLRAGLGRTEGAEGFASHAELFEKRKDVKAVIIATPTHLHKQIALDAIAAGRHVYCESPMAHTAEDCLAIAKAARGAKTVFHVALEGRSNPVYTLARSFFRTEAFKQLIGARAQANQKTAWRTSASDPARDKLLNWRLDPDVSLGLAGEIGTNQFDVIHWYTGKYPTKVVGAGRVAVHQDGRAVADTIAIDFTLEDGSNFAYTSTLGNSFEGRHEVLYGVNSAFKLAWSHGWMFKEADAPTQGWEVYANRQQFHNDEGITLIADATKLASQGKLKDGVGLPNPPAWYALADFLKSVLEGKPVVATADEGARAAQVAIAANKAIVPTSAVSIDPAALRA